MKVKSNQKTDTNIVELEIEVDAEELEGAMQTAYLKESPSMAVPGFRKGKAPRKIIEKMYGEGIFLEEAVNTLYPKAYREAIDETGIEPVAPGDVEILEVDAKSGFTFKATVTVKPEVEVKDYKGIKADKKIKTVTDADVDDEIKRLQERGARLVEVTDRPAENGDTSLIDFEGFVDGVPFEGGKGEEFQLELGSHSFIDGFEEQIVGKNPGDEFDVNVTFPEQYHVEELANQPAVFKVKLHELKAKELPELDDEFAKDVSEFDTLEELRADLKENLKTVNEKSAQDELENDLVSVVIDNLEGEIPEVMYENRTDEMVQEFAQQLASQGMSLDLYLQYTGMNLEEFRKTFREQAARQVKIRLALDKIVEVEKITAPEEKLDEEYKRLADLYKMEEQQIRDIIPAENIAHDVATGMAIDLIRDNAIVTEVEATTEEE